MHIDASMATFLPNWMKIHEQPLLIYSFFTFTFRADRSLLSQKIVYLHSKTRVSGITVNSRGCTRISGTQFYIGGIWLDWIHLSCGEGFPKREQTSRKYPKPTWTLANLRPHIGTVLTSEILLALCADGLRLLDAHFWKKNKKQKKI